MPTLVTPEGRAHRIENKFQLDAFADGRTDINYKLKGNISQLLGFDIIGSDRSGKHEASGFFCVEDCFTTWMYHDGVTVAIPLFGSAPQRFKQLKERASIQFSLPTFKRLVSVPGKRSEDGWWCGSPPAAVAAGLPDGASIYTIPKPATGGTVMPAAQGEVGVPDYGVAACSNLAPTDLVTAPARAVARRRGLNHRVCAPKLAQIKPWFIPNRPPSPEFSRFDRVLSFVAQAGTSEGLRVERSFSAAAGSYEVRFGAFFARSPRPTRCCFKPRANPTSWRRVLTFRSRALVCCAGGHVGGAAR